MIIDNRFYRFKSIFGYRLRALVDPPPPTYGQCPKVSDFFQRMPSLTCQQGCSAQRETYPSWQKSYPCPNKFRFLALVINWIGLAKFEKREVLQEQGKVRRLHQSSGNCQELRLRVIPILDVLTFLLQFTINAKI